MDLIGIMALFGAPLAHEDQAVRACYAALRMQDAVKQYAEGLRRIEGLPIRASSGRAWMTAPTSSGSGASDPARGL